MARQCRVVQHMQAADLVQYIRSLSTNSKAVAVVDVRDDDHAHGHIAGSTHAPSETFKDCLSDYVHRFKEMKRVVFHCMYSQARGPKCARRFAEKCDEVFEEGKGPDVFVLDGGFQGFLREHGKDKDLFEDLDWRAQYS